MQRLLIVTHKMTGGGTERVIAQLLKRFVRDGLDCTLVCECAVPSFYELPHEIHLEYMQGAANLSSHNIPRAYRRLRAIVKRTRPDVVLAMPEKVNVWTVLSLLGTGVPVVVSERNDPRRHPVSKLKRALRKLVYPFASGFIFQTQAAADYFPAYVARRCVVLDNPLDIERIPPRFAGARKKRVVAAGRLHEQKNYPMLIRAFARFYRSHPDFSLTIYGEGGERNALQQLASSLGVAGAVKLAGQSEALLADINDAQLFVMSSDYEGMPNALIEAMASGLCCIATDCPIGGVRSLVEHEENGLLVPTGDWQGLSREMCRAVDDPALMQRLGQNAQAIKTRLDETIVAANWRRYLERIANQ